MKRTLPAAILLIVLFSTLGCDKEAGAPTASFEERMLTNGQKKYWNVNRSIVEDTSYYKGLTRVALRYGGTADLYHSTKGVSSKGYWSWFGNKLYLGDYPYNAAHPDTFRLWNCSRILPTDFILRRNDTVRITPDSLAILDHRLYFVGTAK